MKQFIILDRDGVINEDSDDYIKSPDEWKPIPGSLAAIAALTQADATIVVATNQSGIARGLFTLETLHAIHAKMLAAVEAAGGKIAQIYYCPHHPDEQCECRKPKLGMFHAIARDFQVDLTKALYVGDHWKDIEVGLALKCPVMLVKTGKGAQMAEAHRKEIELYSIPVYENLFQAVNSGIIYDFQENHNN